MIDFPCLLFKENRVVLSKEELMDRLKEAAKIGKSCEVGFYAFSEWKNTEPIVESVILDKVIYTGAQEDLEKLAERKFREGYESILIFDGARYLLFVREPVNDINELKDKEEPGVKVITDVKGKFVFPGYVNPRTGKLSKIIRRWRHESTLDK